MKMVAIVPFVNVVCVLFIAASLWTPGTRAIDLKGYHNVCDSHCVIEDFSTIAKAFERQVTVKKARVVNLTISSRVYSDICQNTAPNNISNSYLEWADNEMEPYLYLPSDFLQFSGIFSLNFKQQMNIHMNCTGKIRRAPPDESNGTSLLGAIMTSLAQDLMRTTGGTLCYPRESEDSTSYTCCQLDKSTSEITCKMFFSSKFVHWFQMLCKLWMCIALIAVPMYLPAVICLFPVYPKVSENGIRCIELGDSSPAGFGSLVAKVFLSQNMDSLVNKTRFFFLRAVLIPCVSGVPLLLAYITPGFSSIVFTTTLFVLGGILYCIYIIYSIISTFSPHSQRKNCGVCESVFSELVVHSDMADEMKVHMSSQLYGAIILCRQFSLGYFNLVKSHVCFPVHIESLTGALWSFCRIFFSVVLLLLAIPAYVVICAYIFSCVFIFISPLGSLCMSEILFVRNLNRSASPGIGSGMKMSVYLYLQAFSCVGLMFWLELNALACGILLPYSIMTFIGDEDTVFPYLALSLLILYYFHNCFTSFSGKYQLLKIKLYDGIQKHISRGGDGGELLLCTKHKATAIPEDLYERACKELRMPLMKNLSLALLKMALLFMFVFTVFGAIMIFGSRSGLPPLTRTVVIFLAGSVPHFLSVFSSGENERKLKEIEMERRLETVITRYAQGQIRDRETRNGEDIDNTEITHTETRYGSTSRTVTIRIQ